jgi:hypothetical protein
MEQRGVAKTLSPYHGGLYQRQVLQFQDHVQYAYGQINYCYLVDTLRNIKENIFRLQNI